MSPSPLLVIDTNVLVSALLSPFGAPGRIWDMVLAHDIRLAYDDRIPVEYERVLKTGEIRIRKRSRGGDAVRFSLSGIHQFQTMAIPVAV